MILNELCHLFLDVLSLGSLHQKPRVSGTLGGVLRDGSDGWRSPVPRGDNTGGRDHLPPQPTIAFQSRRHVPNTVMDRGRSTSWQVSVHPDGSSSGVCSGTSVRSTLWRRGVPLASCCGSGNLNKDVAASMLPTVAAVAHSAFLTVRRHGVSGDTAPPCVTGWAVVFFDANTGAPDR